MTWREIQATCHSRGIHLTYNLDQMGLKIVSDLGPFILRREKASGRQFGLEKNECPSSHWKSRSSAVTLVIEPLFSRNRSVDLTSRYGIWCVKWFVFPRAFWPSPCRTDMKGSARLVGVAPQELQPVYRLVIHAESTKCDYIVQNAN